MQIEEYTADDVAVVAGVVELVRVVEEVDSPWVHPTTATAWVGTLRHGWDGEAPRAFVTTEAGRVVAEATYWTSEWDNQHLAWLEFCVHPDHRRRGIGTALLSRLLDLARAEGRTKVGTDGWDQPPVHAFAAAHGFERASQAVQRRQYLAEIDRDVLRKLHAEAVVAATDYELLRVVGPTPDDLIEQVAVMTAAINDAPTDDLDIEDEVFTAERVRGYENALVGKKQRAYHLIARHRETGELAGHTVVTVELERPAIGHQHDTSVVRSHRGHRLGLLLKSAMLLWLEEAEPQLETIETWNAESNDHMISVNEQLGYRALARSIQFQRAL